MATRLNDSEDTESGPGLRMRSATLVRLRDRFAKRLTEPRALATLALLVVPIVIVVSMGWSRRWTSDDGFINFRIVDLIMHGHGPVFNAGVRVEAETSPLWLAVLFIGGVVLPLRLEWVAVFLALSAMGAGFVFAELGAARVWRHVMGGTGVVVPAGALVFAALAPVWDFSTAGLDTGLAIAWLGIAWWSLCRLVCSEPPTGNGSRTSWWTCLILGLGPLVRPDLAVMSVAFVGVALVTETRSRYRVRALLWAASLTLAYQVFRMVYYAALVPNTALAKEASSSDLWRGWAYFTDFFGTYQLWIPLALLVIAGLVPLLRSQPVRSSHSLMALILAPIIAGTVHAAYVVRVGGDFMHARMLLPSLWCVLLPGAVIIVRSWRWLGTVGLAAWVLVCALFLRVDYIARDISHPGKVGSVSNDAFITNERAEFVEFSRQANPVTLDDYRKAVLVWARVGEALRRRAANGEHGVLVDGFNPHGALLPIRAGLHTPPIVAIVPNVGMYGYAAGPDVYVVDMLGIADPIAARLRIRRGTAGHEKVIDPAWDVARFVDPRSGGQSRAVRDARRALGCADLPKLLRDVSSSLEVHQAWHNFWDSFGLTSLRIPRNPSAAARDLCKG